MARPTQIILDRLQDAVASATGQKITRSQAMQIAAFAFGYHNSNEMAAAACRADFAPPAGEAVGLVRENNSTPEMTIIRDPASNMLYAIESGFIENVCETTRREQYGVSPYGNLINLQPVIDRSDEDLTMIEATEEKRLAQLAMDLARTLSVPESFTDMEVLIKTAGEDLPAKFEMNVTITDANALYYSAVAHYVAEQGRDVTDPKTRKQIMTNALSDAAAMIRDTDAAIVQICDPGSSPEGIQIDESSAETHSFILETQDLEANC